MCLNPSEPLLAVACNHNASEVYVLRYEKLLQCVAECCGVLQRVALSCWQLPAAAAPRKSMCSGTRNCCSASQHVAACCSVLQRVAACCSALQRVVLSCWQLPAAIAPLKSMCSGTINCCGVLQCVATCCGML